jgi:hypothetical protein
LQKIIDEKFNPEALYEGFISSFYEPDPELDEWLAELEEMVDG